MISGFSSALKDTHPCYGLGGFPGRDFNPVILGFSRGASDSAYEFNLVKLIA
jgi:hypothetical protein